MQTNDQSSTQVVPGMISDLHMITATTGWAVSWDIAGTGAYAILRTTDGGKSWQRIISGPSTSQLPTTSDDAYGIAPLTANTRMQFVSPTTGWLAGTTFHGNDSSEGWLYVTHDAGVTWQKVVIPSPGGSVGLDLPVFFTAQNGLLLISTSGPAPQYEQKMLPYTTHDGGQSWTWTGVTTSLNISRDNFIDMDHAWAPSINSTDKLFYSTNDGGQHWSKVPLQTTFKQVTIFSFVSPDFGWATATNFERHLPEPGGGMRKGDIIAILKTTDGGRTWHEVSHSQV